MAVSLSPLVHIPGVSKFGGHFGAHLKYTGFDALEITGIVPDISMIVIGSFKGEIFITTTPVFEQVFDLEKVILEKVIVGQFTAAAFSLVRQFLF